jgi:Holliday junction resolvase
MNSREKGKRGERQWRDELRANGYMARRGQQFAGSPDSPDVVCDELSWLHFEVKAVERLNIEDAMDQARRDCGMRSGECGVNSNSTSPNPLLKDPPGEG